MWFLIRAAFWFSLVLLFLPFGLGGDIKGETVSPLQAVFAAREAVSDVTGICERKPDVCVIGKSAAHTVGVRARETARIAYELLDQQLSEGEPDLQTGSVPVEAAAPAKSGTDAVRDLITQAGTRAVEAALSQTARPN
ncbi:DUF5330 domain-containing protein [Mesorhizobium sp. NBSH29]|uniref:DUF5330 domain-containing protein n=1 Tax=Mesorhizobium sp. NBSH29 TaxID=2654249 RepID=UPI0018967509|nr:DUF5330 domain-containing protein [Mesorhizobium sp. NBSH29]